jgi:hypothetical protein
VRDEGAEYWHIGATMRRFFRVTERMVRGWKRVGVDEREDMAVPGAGEWMGVKYGTAGAGWAAILNGWVIWCFGFFAGARCRRKRRAED